MVALDEQALEEALALKGVLLRRDDFGWNKYVTPDSARQFAWGIGDENPLYCEEEYGRKTRWGAGLAPSCFLFTVDTTVVAPRLPGVTWMYAGVEWEWYLPLTFWRRLRTEVRLVDASLHSGQHVRNFIIQTGECLFFDAQTGELVARALGSTFRIPRASEDGGLSYDSRPPHRYSSAELEAIDECVRAETAQGAAVRYWDDVQPGDELSPVVKGPLNSTDMICWYSTGHFYRAYERAVRYRWRHPGHAYMNEQTGAPDNPARGHAEASMARAVGMPGIYDGGPQRISFANHLLSNWMGDDGFLRVLKMRVTRPNVLGDTTWVRGTVTAKSDEIRPALAGPGSCSEVSIDLKMVNQMGVTTANGSASVLLPRRDQSDASR
jgi:acyl dehydratase